MRAAAICGYIFWFFGSCDPCEAKQVAAERKLFQAQATPVQVRAASFVEFSDSGLGYTCCIGASESFRVSQEDSKIFDFQCLGGVHVVLVVVWSYCGTIQIRGPHL